MRGVLVQTRSPCHPALSQDVFCVLPLRLSRKSCRWALGAAGAALLAWVAREAINRCPEEALGVGVRG